MRINKEDLDSELNRVLEKKSKLSPTAEIALFLRAEELLAARREQQTSREIKKRRVSQRSFATRSWLDFFAFNPDASATAIIFATLLLAFVAVREGRRSGSTLHHNSDSDLFSNYDAQWLVERQAYEREVEDAHQKTSGEI